MMEKLTKSDIGSLIAAAVMALGAFCPIIRLPIVGSLNYVMGGRGDGIFVLGCSAAVVLCIACGYRRTTGLLASAALVMMMMAMARFAGTMSQAQLTLSKDNGPFSRLAEIMVSSVGLEWGWILLIGGALTIIILAFTSHFDSAAAAREGAAVVPTQEHTDSYSSADKMFAEYLENKKVWPASRDRSKLPPNFGKRR
jgi:hypothetical protein